jgi:hypothetical protein
MSASSARSAPGHAGTEDRAIDDRPRSRITVLYLSQPSRSSGTADEGTPAAHDVAALFLRRRAVLSCVSCAKHTLGAGCASDSRQNVLEAPESAPAFFAHDTRNSKPRQLPWRQRQDVDGAELGKRIGRPTPPM